MMNLFPALFRGGEPLDNARTSQSAITAVTQSSGPDSESDTKIDTNRLLADSGG
jgi:hypothetical protein